MFSPYRKAVQIAVFSAMFAVPLLNLYEVYAVTGTFYAINVGGLGIADPVVILQAIFASGELTVPLLGAALFPVLLAMLFGRIWCGWMCPYHLLADGVAWLRIRLGRILFDTTGSVQRLPVPSSFRANMTRFGFLVLGTAAAGAIGIPVLNYVNAPGIISTEAMILIKERSLSLEIGFIAAILVLELTFLPRFWCRLFCPTGALISVFRTPFSLTVATAIQTPRGACCKDNRCSASCPMGLKPYRQGQDMLCTNCGQCIDACREGAGTGGLRFKGFAGKA